MPPRVTKAQLQAQVDELEAENEGLEHDNNYLVSQNEELKKENKKLKDQVRRGNARSRSPQRPAASAEANVNLTCRALRQVSLWQQAPVVQEHRDEIQRLREELAKKDEQIASLRRGEGPIGPVLYEIRRRENTIHNIEGYPGTQQRYERQIQPVMYFVRTMQRLHNDMREFAIEGGALIRAEQIPTRSLW